MAEIVSHNQERSIPEYELIRKHQIMTEERLRVIIKTRESYQYKLSRSGRTLRDYGAFIIFEKKLVEMVKAIEVSRKQQFPGLKAAMANRIVRLYKEGIRFYPNEARLFDAYLKFCKSNFPSEVPNAFEMLIQKRGDKPKVWNNAAMWFHEQGNNMEQVKGIFFRALQRHPDSELLFTSFFRVLLSETAEMPKDLQLASLERVMSIYNAAKKKICNIKFLVNLIKQCQEEQHVEFTKPLQELILNDMLLLYPREEDVWDILARRVLAGEPIDNFLDQAAANGFASEIRNNDAMDTKDMKDDLTTTPKPTLKARIEGCFKVYQTAIAILKTPAIWSLLIRCMIELNNDLTTQPVLKRKKLATAFRGAHDANCMSEEHYHAYITLLLESNSDKDFTMQIMVEATTRFTSLKLWEQRLGYHIMQNDKVKVYEVFRQATELLGVNSFPIWKLTIQFFMLALADKNKFLQIMREACAIDAPQFLAFRPQFLEWSVVNQPFTATRLLYEELRTLTPPSLELHRKMALLETQRLKPDIEMVRHCYENALFDFGKMHTAVWIEFIKFERDIGEPKRMSALCERAKNTLAPMFVDNFVTEHCLLMVATYK
ncbi:U3 small nucleolar RNA-associated protein 6 homolog isoform X2 [Episyrphus balteatus]|uniref:U3 small nucleolar RNA-associated protein 6 homolog isoform X2 n=1 Tax=Episyrphus balteatus TaxID=286459 RepID=UPI002486B81E|nr:U3 small nucleolar RNA-associated protein 6 homolog isoform X2 [Episyrphus balteatus]